MEVQKRFHDPSFSRFFSTVGSPLDSVLDTRKTRVFLWPKTNRGEPARNARKPAGTGPKRANPNANPNFFRGVKFRKFSLKTRDRECFGELDRVGREIPDFTFREFAGFPSLRHGTAFRNAIV